MRQWLAILGDSFREARDRRTFGVLAGIALLITLFTAATAFDVRSLEEALETAALDLARLRDFQGGTVHIQVPRVDLDVAVEEVRALRPQDAAPPGFEGGHVALVRFGKRAELEELAEAWQRRRRADAAPPRLEEFLRQRFLESGWDPVAVTELPDPGDAASAVRFRVLARSEDPRQLVGGVRLSFLFGLFGPYEFRGISRAELASLLEVGFANSFAGSLGMLLVILTSAGFIPAMLQKGTVELLLARPIGRSRLLLYKTSGAVAFVAAFAVVLFGGFWVALSARTGTWNPWFLPCSLTVPATFAVVYSVVVLAGVVTRNSVLSALAGLAVWWASSAVTALERDLGGMPLGDDLRRGIHALYVVLPKTGDFGLLNAVFLSRAHLSEAMWERTVPKALAEVDWAFSLGTTAAFVAVMLALACWRFRARDL